MSPGLNLPPLLAAFAVELYRYHCPSIHLKVSDHAQKQYDLLTEFVWGLLVEDGDLLDEVARKWPQM